MKLVIFCVAILSSFFSYASDIEIIKDKTKVEKILKSIPSNDREMPYKNLADRLPNLGLTVDLISIGELESDEINSSDGLYKRGDVLYEFSTNESNSAVTQICPILSIFSFIKRGNTWLPQTRTANFLMNGYTCVAP